MTVYLWRAYVDDRLEAAGQRHDHKGTSEALAVEVGTELRLAGVRATEVSVRMAGCVDAVVGVDSEAVPSLTREAAMCAARIRPAVSPTSLHGPPR